MKRLIFLFLIVISFAAKSQNLYGVAVTKENGSTVSGYTAYLNPSQIFYIVKKTAPGIWYQDNVLGKAVKYTVSTNADSIYAQIARLKMAALVKVLKTEKVATRDTTIQYLLGTANILSAKAKTFTAFTPARTAVRVKQGSLSVELPIVESGAVLKARIDSIRTANP